MKKSESGLMYLITMLKEVIRYSCLKEIFAKITLNIYAEMESKVHYILLSPNLHSKVFALRRRLETIGRIDSPLRDQNGIIQVSKPEIDAIITNHFRNVFNQNATPNDKLWQD